MMTIVRNGFSQVGHNRNDCAQPTEKEKLKPCTTRSGRVNTFIVVLLARSFQRTPAGPSIDVERAYQEPSSVTPQSPPRLLERG